MSVHNGARYLAEAVDSILSQGFADFEFLVIDDGSTDASAVILRGYSDPRLRVIHNPRNLGLTRSLNRGLGEARGRYVARQDADDSSHPDRLARQVTFLDANPNVALLGTGVRIINGRGRRRGLDVEVRPSTYHGIQWRLLFGNPFAHTSTMFRRDVVWGEFGGYDESCVFSQDFDLWSRVLTRYQGVNLPEPLVNYRSHGMSIVGRHDQGVRASHVAVNIEVLRRNILRILRRDDLAERWPPLWTSLYVGRWTSAAAQPEAPMELVSEMHRHYVTLYPDAAGNPELNDALAGVLSHLACALAVTHRRVALRAYSAAIRARPSLAARNAARFVALLCMGDAAITAARRLRSFAARREQGHSGSGSPS
jgi:glycosyltransferase involved in cell wall biosynthesis